jgi:hypothetical protein
MDRFSEKVFGLLVWRAFLITLVAILLTIARDLPLRVAFLAGANVALLFSLGLVAWSESLTDERVVSTQAWRMLNPGQRPAGRRRGFAVCRGRVGCRCRFVGSRARIRGLVPRFRSS